MTQTMVMGKITIRNAKVKDYLKCLPLLATLYHNDIGKDFKNTFETYLIGDDCVVLLALCRGMVAGVLIGSYQVDIDWEGKTARVDGIVVDEKFRGKGIGRQLVNRFVILARKQECKAIRSRVNTKNEIAQRFHESLGFEKAETYEYMLDLLRSM